MIQANIPHIKSILHFSHQDVWFGAFENHTKGREFKCLTNMGYEKKFLGFHDQGVVNHIKPIKRDIYVGL